MLRANDKAKFGGFERLGQKRIMIKKSRVAAVVLPVFSPIVASMYGVGTTRKMNLLSNA